VLTIVVVAALSFGVNVALWSVIGVMRWLAERRAPPGGDEAPPREAVAVLIAARNEALVIEGTLAAAARQLPATQIHVVSDGSTDDTAELARGAGVNVLALARNRGKAAALEAGVEHFDLCRVYQVVVIVDADTELSEDYLESGLPLFADRHVAVVAGMAHTAWRLNDLPTLGRILLAYRERLYLLAQYMLKYGQGWAAVDAVVVAPGCASMYRASALAELRIDVPGLVIEDFQMSFATHRQRLGRIAFHPRAAVAFTQDPTNLRDYRRQVRRWALGYWQSVLRSRWRHGTFDLALGVLSAELFTSAMVFVLVVVAVLASLVGLADPQLHLLGARTAAELALGLAAPDLVMSLAVASLRRESAFLTYALAFPFLRVLDAWLSLRGLVSAFLTRSSGRWISPARRAETIGRAPASSERPLGRRGALLRGGGVALSAAVVVAVVAAAFAIQKSYPDARCAEPPPANERAPYAGELRAVSHVLSYTSYIARGTPNKPEVALTFDDGPGPYTPEILAVLRRLHVPATFFVIGQQVHYYGKFLSSELVQQVVIGDHTLTHPYLSRLTAAGQRGQIQGQVGAVEACGAPYPHLFRPPYGAFNKTTLRLLKRAGMLMVLWSVDTKDWKLPGVNAIVHNALATAGPGSIILMHDGDSNRGETVAALPRIIAGLRARHLRLVTIPQLLVDDPPPRGQPQPRPVSGNG
jgi:peptidoglycan/xylan/chitin deacetylase (PgdA/CDA1 family)/cellulose synthase/poly-beta-1,6-N-acetylglucosamine synthase-like glycosyltransferase